MAICELGSRLISAPVQKQSPGHNTAAYEGQVRYFSVEAVTSKVVQIVPELVYIHFCAENDLALGQY